MYIYGSAQAVTIPAAGSWQTIDLSGAPFNVPSGACFALIRARVQSPKNLVRLSIRKPGSSFAHQNYRIQWNNPGTQDILVPLSASQIEVYSGYTTDADFTFSLIAYFDASEGSAFAEPLDITPGSGTLLDGAWRTFDLSASIPSTAKWAVCQFVVNDTAVYAAAFAGCNYRKTGGSSPFSGDFGVTRQKTWWLAPVDSLSRIDFQGTNTSGFGTATLHVLGYLTCGSHNSDPLGTDTETHTSSAGWETKTAAVTTADCIVLMGPSNQAGSGFGWRKNGSTDAILGAVSQPCLMIVPIDGSGQWNWYSTGSSTVYTLGYLETAMILSDTAAASDQLVQDLYTRDITETAVAADLTRYGNDSDQTRSESAVSSDVVVAEHAKGAVVAETAAASDVVEGASSKSIPGAVVVPIAKVLGTMATGTIITVSVTVPVAIVDSQLSYGMALSVNLTVPQVRVLGSLEEVVASGEIISKVVDVSGMIAPGAAAAAAVATVPKISGLILFGNKISEDVTVPFVSISGSTFASYAATGELQAPRPVISGQIVIVPVLVAGRYRIYVMNLANFSVTETSINAESICECGGEYFYADGSGIYKMDGDHDAGQPIPWEILKSGIDLGVPQLKHFTDLYLLAEARRTMRFDVFSEDAVGGTNVLPGGPTRGHKADLPLGGIGRQMGFRLFATGVKAEIEEMELVADVFMQKRGRQARA